MINEIVASVITDTSDVVSSLQLVELVNLERKANGKKSNLRHDNVTRKTKEVLGTRDALKFEGVYLGANGEARPCYYYPKREASLMAMAYSYTLQAAVYDRMTELEKTPPVRELTMAEMTLAVISGLQEDVVKLERQRDDAVRTKSQISSSREASVMGKLSAAMAKLEKYESNVRHATVDYVQRRTGVLYPWLPLRNWCDDQDLPVVVEPVGAKRDWPAGAWAHCYDINLAEL